MRRVNRREFLALTGAAPLGLASFKPRPGRPARRSSPDERIDPWIELNTRNLAWNLAQVRKRIGVHPAIMAVVKCNAYGHGLVEIASSLEKEGVRHFAVVKVPEAVSLRENGIKGMILNFGPFSREEAEELVRFNVSQSVYSERVDALADAARRLNKKARVHIKVDTGLGRVGVPYDRALPFIKKAASMKEVVLEGLFTTLTEEEDFDKIQIERLLQICAEARADGISPGLRHAASSAAVSEFPAAALDMVRPGNSLYGIETLPHMDLKPVMGLKTRVIYVKKIRQGDTVGYHRRYRAEKEMLLATLPIGYSDGYPAQVVDKAQVLIQGKRWPVIGYISANHGLVDITGSTGIKIGDEVVLVGPQNGREIKLQEVADWAESSVYRIAIGMSPFLPRILMDR